MALNGCWFTECLIVRFNSTFSQRALRSLVKFNCRIQATDYSFTTEKHLYPIYLDAGGWGHLSSIVSWPVMVSFNSACVGSSRSSVYSPGYTTKLPD